MIGATAGKYLSSDAVFTIAPNATMDMTIHSGTITLNETLWYTMEGQTLTIAEAATFVIPAGKTLYVNGSNVVVNGTAANFGTLILANGAHVKGDIAGTFQMAGGTYETSKYVMIGATEGKYLSTDAVFTIVPNATMDMTVVSGTITLNDADWWTLQGQTLTIAKDAKFVVPAGKNINVQGTVIVEGTAVTEGTVTLYNENATVTAAAGLNVITKIAGKKVAYLNGTYQVIAEEVKAYNAVTGEIYDDLQAALSAAAKGETVALLADVVAGDLIIGSGKTLDLNGFALTADSFSASFNGAAIIDSTNGTGLLKVAPESLSLNKNNPQLPLWYDEGIRFVDVAFGQLLSFRDKNKQENANIAFYRFAFKAEAADTILDDYLAAGGEGVTIRIKASWKTANGIVTQYFTYSDALVQAYLTKGWDKSQFEMYLTGVEGLDISFNAEIVSVAGECEQTTVIIASIPVK
jgi:hypothetical protein